MLFIRLLEDLIRSIRLSIAFSHKVVEILITIILFLLIYPWPQYFKSKIAFLNFTVIFYLEIDLGC